MDNNYIVSARKYRPVTFQSVVGQKSLTTTLKNAIQNNKLAHAYLFCGPRGVGKTTCARIFAKTINCMQPQADGEACNECESCRSFNENRSYNIYELDAASNNSVDDIRSLTDQVRIPPQIGKYKVYIIDEVHMLSTQAFNAFLKTLEEPPHHAIFILATTEKHKIIPTILSRCQIYDFSRITINDMVDHLEYVAKSEQVSTEREALTAIAQKADGGMRDALSIFDQIVSFSGGNVSYQAVIANLNLLDYEYYFRLAGFLLNGDVSQSLLVLNEIVGKGFDGQQILSGLALFFRDVLVCKDPQTIVLFEVGDAVKEKYLDLAQRCTSGFLYKALEWTNESDLNYRYSKNKRLLIELLLIRLCQFSTSSSPAEDKKKITLEPITVPTIAVPAITVPTPVASKETPVTPKETPAAPVVTVTQVPESSGLPKDSNMRFSLKKDHPPAPETILPEEAVPPSVQDNSFTQTALEKAWKEYAGKEEDVHLKNTILNITPQLQEANRICIAVFNPDQESKLKDRAGDIKQFLSQQLQNTHIELDIAITEDKNDLLPYGGKEIFQFMAEKNPAIVTLATEFNLVLR
ncbi:MAG: DNA polymerase III subunit gamma/tau [Dysgonamonadaceae bacterium]|jgi:DNA polymerase-3 subunit gamma/tau|nr:DNA polymerase III subunit gamma/tau [Dysgonamonadaceae bacterium]